MSGEMLGSEAQQSEATVGNGSTDARKKDAIDLLVRNLDRKIAVETRLTQSNASDRPTTNKLSNTKAVPPPRPKALPKSYVSPFLSNDEAQSSKVQEFGLYFPHKPKDASAKERPKRPPNPNVLNINGEHETLEVPDHLSNLEKSFSAPNSPRNSFVFDETTRSPARRTQLDQLNTTDKGLNRRRSFSTSSTDDFRRIRPSGAVKDGPEKGEEDPPQTPLRRILRFFRSESSDVPKEGDHHSKKAVKTIGEHSGNSPDSEDFRSAKLKSVPTDKSGIQRVEGPSKQRYSDEYPHLFEYLLIVGIKKEGGKPVPSVTYRFPAKEDHHMVKADPLLDNIHQFCFPDIDTIKPVKKSEKYSFVLTDITGDRRFGYCRRIRSTQKGSSYPEVLCIISPLGCFELYDKILDEIEVRRKSAPNAVFTLLKAVYSNPFPAPGSTVSVKVFSPGKGKSLIPEELHFTRSVDNRLEHVDFGDLLAFTTVKKILYIVSTILVERRVILTSKKLSSLTSCSLAIMALLYPLTWQHVFVPVLPNDLVDMALSPVPFFLGMSNQAAKKVETMETEELLLIDLDSSKRLIKKGDEDNILPHHIWSYLLNELDIISSLPEAKRGGSQEFNHQMSEIFIKVFVYFLSRIPKYLVLHGDEVELQKERYLSSFPQDDHSFLKIFMKTQMFDSYLVLKEQVLLTGKPQNGYFEEQCRLSAEATQDPAAFFKKRPAKSSKFGRKK